MEYKKLEDIIEFNPTETLKKGTVSKKIPMDKLGVFSKYINSFDIEKYNGGMKFRNGDTLLARITPCLENGKTSKVTILDEEEVGFGSTEYIVMRSKKNISDEDFIFYLAISPKFREIAIKSMTGTSGRQRVQLDVVKNTEMLIPSYEEQIKIGKVLSSIDKRIELNNQINDNLSEQLKQIFNNKFYDKIQNNDCSEFKEYILYDVLDVIDNRGKTPKLVEVSNYPIIDVRAISGENRIIDYKQCQKYVDDEVYNTFFRSGHPKINDILISTVGSLAEMKIYMENKGTIAQNVVALRSKYDYPMYIYQYLKAIKNDLISYNIGSVQPSIKVTQFMKHNIYIPKDKDLYEFENIAKLYTDKMFNISKENETLEQLRDTLLPKLMNGEIDLDKIEI